MKSIFNLNKAIATDVGVLIARVGIAALMLTHGLPKMMMLFSGSAVQFPSVLGMSPEISLGLTVFAEVICSLLLFVGLATRLVAIPLIITMVVAAATTGYLLRSDSTESESPTRVGADGSSSAGRGDVAPSHADARPVIRIGMSAAFVSESGVEVYQKISDYLSRHSGTRCEFVSGLSYATLNEMLEDGALHVAFVCGLPYVLHQEQEKPPTRLLAAPVMKAPQYGGEPKYFSYAIVRKESSYQSFADLKGCVYVYNDELSNSGYNLPRSRLVELGETKGFFSKVLRSGSHEESIRMVAEGKADASSVDSLVYDYDLAKHPQFASQLKVIERLGPAGICPVVASAVLNEEVFQQVQSALIDMHEDADGRAILEEALVDRFIPVSDDTYDDIRQHLKAARDAKFLEIK